MAMFLNPMGSNTRKTMTEKLVVRRNFLTFSGCCQKDPSHGNRNKWDEVRTYGRCHAQKRTGEQKMTVGSGSSIEN